MSSGTPGPWHVHDRCSRHINDRVVCRVGESHLVVSHDAPEAPHRLQAQIDARHIALTPELLALARKVLDAERLLACNDTPDCGCEGTHAGCHLLDEAHRLLERAGEDV